MFQLFATASPFEHICCKSKFFLIYKIFEFHDAALKVYEPLIYG